MDLLFKAPLRIDFEVFLRHEPLTSDTVGRKVDTNCKKVFLTLSLWRGPQQCLFMFSWVVFFWGRHGAALTVWMFSLFLLFASLPVSQRAG